MDTAQFVAGADRGGIAPQAGAVRAPSLIEDFHQVEKTGCGEEDLRFETDEARCRCWECCRWWRCGCCSCGGGDASTVRRRPRRRRRLRNMEVIRRMGDRVQMARDFVHAVAKLGGFLGLCSDGRPGWKTLWRGHQRLQDMLMGMKLGGRTPAVVIDTNPYRSKSPP